ncbi:hypothetical protein SEA_EYRE_64 [Gordonia phage Eyre]|uniref:Uncharacterized protein n=1 Tax=Gordonia phage Eyre TaxID=1887646 RepID=A0A1B3B017_9CAUD|nr:hypothetical protein BIZ73_gp64 [Gordonia phage Eyre]AOE44344.1 hypothetical protein SEA_EYRE_64 [Gordonia phage Eyre]
MAEFSVGDRVTWLGPGATGTERMAGKVVDQPPQVLWAPLGAHWVEVTHGVETLDEWAAQACGLSPGDLGALIYLFPDQMEHLD